MNPAGVVSTVADQDIRSNGIMLSPDGRTLYVTNNTNVLAFDVRADGTTANRRDFGTLDGDDGGDGMAVDSEGRLYVTGNRGVHVLSPRGEHLGLIPTPRRPITIAFSGPDKNLLYAPSSGAVGPDGKAWATPETIRNTAMTIYRCRCCRRATKAGRSRRGATSLSPRRRRAVSMKRNRRRPRSMMSPWRSVLPSSRASR